MNRFSNLTLVLLLLTSVFTPYVSTAGEQVLTQISEKIFQNSKNDQMWQMGKSKRLKTASSVEEYLKQLNQGEYKDWRLPTKQELFELFSYFDLKQHGSVKISLEGAYWIENDGIQVGAWEIGDQCGPSRTFYTKKAGSIKAIRP
jgi:hypothetical protein